ncbi:ATP-binding protein [Geopsychrobacter electrodiphilus]|uniref:ATP-binding protein n=1 Tax=Geopsychrobacter electrodiphilus TaxID=225196 RepID=UPI00039F62B2|nr:ATP-binding protein [Geopsychrobacter electrodiphilus]
MSQTPPTQLSRKSTDQLFSCPRVLVQFLDACLRQEPRQHFVAILQQDAALAVRILQAATTSSSEPIPANEPLSTALDRLSPATLSAIGLRAAGRYLEEHLGLSQSRFRQTLWLHSRVAGIAARSLAEALSYARSEEAQLAGMLHNIGMQLLFAQDSAHYHTKVVHPASSAEVCRHELKAYGDDHLHLAAELAESWRLESFLPDALASLHHPQAEGGGVLIRLLQLAHALSVSPAHLSCEALDLAQRYFDLAPAAVQEIFAEVERQYRGFSKYVGDPDRLQQEELDASLQLRKLSFLLAERQACLVQLGHCDSLPQLLSTGRSLLLQKLDVRETIFLLADAHKGVLCGMPVNGQSQLVTDLQVPMDPAFSLVGRCLIEGGVHDSATISPGEITVVDRTLLRLTASSRFACLPLSTKDPFGVVVIGLDETQDIEAFATGETQVLCHAIGRGLRTYVQSGMLLGRRGGDRIELRRVAHEINNPLAIMGNYLQVLRQQQGNDEVLSAMEDEIQRVTEILGYYSRQQERSPLPVSLVDVKELIESVLTSMKPTTLTPRRIEVVAAFDQMQPIAINPIVLRQILINLIKNAAESLPPEGRIELQSSEMLEANGEKQVEIVVADNGPGIAPQLFNQLFNPVTSSKGSGHAGLGLNIVRNMAKDIGVRISCQSRPETGTCFRILIPRHGTEKPVLE